MAGLELCSKHNMVAYLEKTNGNTEFHQIMDFLIHNSIYYALTVSPIVSTSFVEQFWTTANSGTVNNTSYIDAKVAGKPVTISEAPIRSDLLFDDADGIDSLNNKAIFNTIQLMGNQLKDVPVPLDFSVPTLTKKVLTFMVKKGKNFSGKVTPLFDSMLVQQTEDEGDASERPPDSPPIPSPPHPSEDQPQIQPDLSPNPSPTTHIPDSIPEGSGGNHGGQSSNDASLLRNEDGLTLQSVYDLFVSLCKQVTAQAKEIQALKAQGRKSVKSFKGEPSVHKDPAFDDLDDFVDVDDTLDYMESEDAQDKGRTSSVVLEEKKSANEGVSTEAPISTAKKNDGTDKQNEGTDKKNEGTDKQDGSTDSTKVSTDRQGEVLIIMSQNKEKLKEKEKGVEIRNIEDTERPRLTLTRSILTLRPLPKIDLKDKGKKRIEEEDESDTKSEGITEAKKKFKPLLLNVDQILAKKLQEEEREMYTIEQRTKFLHDTIAAQRRFLAQQRSEAIRNITPSRNQLRNQMMTYLKHVGGKKHSDLKTKNEKMIKEMNERAVDASKKRVKKDDSVTGEIKEELCLTIAPDEDKEVDYEILDKKYPIIEWRSGYLTTKPRYDETEEVEDVYLNVVIRSNRQRRYFSTLMAES
ncbi:hypothetical protein Tco_0378803 [Tanacetum coccineum]